MAEEPKNVPTNTGDEGASPGPLLRGALLKRPAAQQAKVDSANKADEQILDKSDIRDPAMATKNYEARTRINDRQTPFERQQYANEKGYGYIDTPKDKPRQTSYAGTRNTTRR